MCKSVLLMLADHVSLSLGFLQVMADVDIPTELVTRLEQERHKSDLDNKLRLHVSNLRQIYYFLEEDVAAFHQYSLKEDFVSEGSLRVLTCGRGFHFIGLQMALAAELDVYPHQVELWCTVSAANQRLRLVEKMSAGAVVRSCDMPYFVRVLGSKDTAEVTSSIIERYTRLQREEVLLQDAIRTALSPAGVELPFDPSEGCGIGRGQFTMKRIVDTATRENQQQTYNTLLEEAVGIVNTLVLPVLQTHQLMFFKVFDVDNRLPRLTLGTGAGGKGGHIQSHDNCPIMYIGSEYIDESDSLVDMRTTVFGMLRGFFERGGKSMPDEWRNLHFFLMTSEGDMVCLSSDEVRYKEDLEDGDVICCVPGPAVESDILLREQEAEAYSALTTFMRYEINKMVFRVGPCSYIPSQAKYFKRACGLWTVSQCPLPDLTAIGDPSEEDRECTLSLMQTCQQVVRDVSCLVRSTDDKLVVGKEYIAQERHMFRPLLPDGEVALTKYLRPFVKGMNSHDLYSLQVACLPLDPLPAYSNKRYLEFNLVDQRMRDQRREWLERDIYPQAVHLYNIQRKFISSMTSTSEGEVQLGQLRPVSGDINWPRGVTAVADEFVSDSRLYLSVDVDIGLTVHDVLQEVRRNIRVLTDPRPSDGEHQREGEGEGKGPRKRSAGEEAALSEDRNVRSRPNGMNEEDKDRDSSVTEECVWADLIYPSEVVPPDSADSFILAFATMDHSIISYLRADGAVSTIRRNW